jgi:tellurite methyltransferase
LFFRAHFSSRGVKNPLRPSQRSWDERYGEKPAGSEPGDLLVGFSALLPSGGRALDLACGGGRNALYLAQCGLRVVGVERSWKALEQGRELAHQKNLPVDWVQADLENFAIPRAAFDVVVCFYYRDPGLYAKIRQALRSGGLLFYETFTRDQLRLASGPRHPAHLLGPGELLEAFGDWDVIFYRETWIECGAAALVARKPQAY